MHFQMLVTWVCTTRNKCCKRHWEYYRERDNGVNRRCDINKNSLIRFYSSGSVRLLLLQKVPSKQGGRD